MSIFAAYLPIFIAAVALVGYSAQQAKRRRTVDEWAGVAAAIRLPRTNPSFVTPKWQGGIGSAAFLIERIERSGMPGYVTTIRITALDRELSAKNEPEQRVRAGGKIGPDMRLGDHDFDRLLRISGDADAWCSRADARVRKAFVEIAGMHQFRFEEGALTIEQHLPPQELIDCTRRLTALTAALEAARADPARTLLNNVETSEAPFAARALWLLKTKFPRSAGHAAAVESAGRFCARDARKEEHAARLLVFHPDAAVKRKAIAELGEIGVPATAKFLHALGGAEVSLEIEAAMAAIAERYPDLGGGQVSVVGDDAAGALSTAQLDARKQRT